MTPELDPACIAFDGDRCIAAGDLREVAAAAKQALDQHRDAAIIVFDGHTSATIDVDFRGSIAQVLARLPDQQPVAGSSPDIATSPPRGPGRPKLGVVAREVTLLPRHWEWLARQPGGASVAIRKLVEHASRTSEDKDRVREAQEAAYRFMSVTSGNKPKYEDAIRALFAGDAARFADLIAEWPADIRAHATRLAKRAFPGATQATPVDPAGATR